jgi:hypothetical protein
MASDGKWYAPELHPDYRPPSPNPPPAPVAAPPAPQPPQQTGPPPGWWQATDGNWYPPQQAPAAPEGKKKFYTRVWFWLLVVVALGIGGCFAILGAVSTSINNADKTKHTAVYTITGDGTADITYDSFINGNSGSSDNNGVALPWTKSVTGSGLFTFYSVVAMLKSGTTVTCSITLDGRQVATHTSTGQFATVTCAG